MASTNVEEISITLKNDTNEDVNALLTELFALQEERVKTYSSFDMRFKEYLLDAPAFDALRLQMLCKTVSERLNEISLSIITIKKKLSGSGGFAALVERLQSLEEAKFKQTLEMYICEQQRLEKLAQTDEFENEYVAKLSSFRKNVNEIKNSVNDCLEEIRYEMHPNM